MKKQILILCFAILGIAAYSQDTLKVKKEESRKFIGFSLFDHEDRNYDRSMAGINFIYEEFFDSTNVSGIITINVMEQNIQNLYVGFRKYSSKRYFKFFAEGGICFINYYKRFNVGLGLKAGINLGHLKGFNTDFFVDYNAVTNGYNFYEVGVSFKFKSFFKD